MKLDKEYYKKKYKEIDVKPLEIKQDFERRRMVIGDWESVDLPHLSLGYGNIRKIIDKNYKKELEKFNKIKFKHEMHKENAFKKFFWNKKLDKVYTARCLEMYIEKRFKEEDKNKLYNTIVYKYCYTKGGKINISRVLILERNFQFFEKLYNDGQERAIPLLIEFKVSSYNSVEDLYKFLKSNKSIWKISLKQSVNRAKKLGSLMSSYQNNRSIDLYKKLFKSKTKVLNFIYNTNPSGISESVIIFLNKNYYGNDLRELFCLFRDTERLCSRTNNYFNPNWSIKRMQREHDEKIIELNKINEEKRIEKKELYKKEVTSINKYIEYFNKNVDYKNLKVEYLKTGFEVQREGRYMGHCIASYSMDFAKGGFVIARIMDRHRPFTLAIAVYGTGRISFEQCAGIRNSKPTGDVATLVKRFESAIAIWNKSIDNTSHHPS